METYVLRGILGNTKSGRRVMKIIVHNGFQLTGKILDYDDLCINVEDMRGDINCVMLGAISTITPYRSPKERIDYGEMFQ